MSVREKEGFLASGAGRTELPLSELEKEVRNKPGRYSVAAIISLRNHILAQRLVQQWACDPA